LKSWNGSYQFTGDGDFGKETWNFISMWSCLGEKAGEPSDAYWKYYLSINRKVESRNIDFDTKISIVFPPQELCRLIDNLFVDFSFRLNTITQYVENSFVNVNDYVIITDKINMFKDTDWTQNPWLSIKLSRNASTSLLQTIDLSPIIPQ
jgi:hypothetical protein